MISCALTTKECHKPCLFRLIILVRYYVLSRPSTSRSLNCRFPSVLTRDHRHHRQHYRRHVFRRRAPRYVYYDQLVRRSFCMLLFLFFVYVTREFSVLYRLPPETHAPGLFSSNEISDAAWIIAFIGRFSEMQYNRTEIVLCAAYPTFSCLHPFALSHWFA